MMPTTEIPGLLGIIGVFVTAYLGTAIRRGKPMSRRLHYR